MHLAFLILCKSAVSSAHPSKSKPAAVKVIVASWPVGVIPRIVTASPPHMSHGGRSSVNIFPIMHDNSAPLQAHRVNIRSVATPRSNARCGHAVQIVKEDQERVCCNVIEKHGFQHFNSRCVVLDQVQQMPRGVFVKDIL